MSLFHKQYWLQHIDKPHSTLLSLGFGARYVHPWSSAASLSRFVTVGLVNTLATLIITFDMPGATPRDHDQPLHLSNVSLVILFCLDWGVHLRSRHFALSVDTPYQALLQILFEADFRHFHVAVRTCEIWVGLHVLQSRR